MLYNRSTLKNQQFKEIITSVCKRLVTTVSVKYFGPNHSIKP